MLIDPFTVIAQIVNFAILVIALKYFLYDRVIEAMDRREASVAERLTEAEQREATAADEAERLREERAQLDRHRDDLLDAARGDAAEHRDELLERARAEVEAERARWERGLRAEQQEFRGDLQRHTVKEVMELSRRALSDLAGADLEGAVIDRALEHLASHDDEREEVFAVDDPEHSVTVRTAFTSPTTSAGRSKVSSEPWGSTPEVEFASNTIPSWCSASSSAGTALRSAGTPRTISRSCPRGWTSWRRVWTESERTTTGGEHDGAQH
jgi:F-type H+-transporting ATPase subunit b